MGYGAKVIKDSISPAGVRITTIEVSFPRIVLAELNTHRMLSKSSASSRAIPVEKMIANAMEDPFIPIYWGKNQKGMAASEQLSADDQADVELLWLRARDYAVRFAKALALKPPHGFDVHKQIANRLLEPFLFHTVIVTATEWSNFFALRRHPAAHPEIRRAADLMWEAREASRPTPLNHGDWHLPYLNAEEKHELLARPEVWGKDIWEELCLISSGRSARVSYLTHDGVRDPKKDIELAKSCLAAGHMGPFEHVARPVDPWPDGPHNTGNFRGWLQYRKTIPNEHDFGLLSGGGT